MTKPKFFGTVQNGYLILKDQLKFEQHIRQFEEKEVEITIAKKFKKRTSGQPGEETNFNGYYWQYIVAPIAEVMGELDDKEVHNILQMLFNKKGISVVDPATKQRMNVEIPAGTSTLSGAEFANYCSKIRMWASIPGNLSTTGVFLAAPNETEFDYSE